MTRLNDLLISLKRIVRRTPTNVDCGQFWRRILLVRGFPCQKGDSHPYSEVKISMHQMQVHMAVCFEGVLFGVVFKGT